MIKMKSMRAKKMMKIKDRKFKIEKATFDAIIYESGGIGWTFEIDTEEIYYDGTVWKPRLYGEGMDLRIPDLSQVDNFKISVPDAYDYKTEKYFFALYIFNHEDVYENQIQFKKIKKNIFNIIWQGKCDVNYTEDFSTGLNLELDTLIEFEDIAIEKIHDKEKALEVFGKHYDPKWYSLTDSNYGIRFKLL